MGPNRLALSASTRKTGFQSKKTNQVCRVCFARNNLRTFLLLSLLVLASIGLAAESAALLQKLFRGKIVSTGGKPVANATVEIRDLRGIRIGRSITDNTGRFEISAAARPDEYMVLVGKGSLIKGERVVLDRRDVEIAIALPVAREDVAPEPPEQTVSAARLSVQGRTWKHLESAHAQFAKGNLPLAETEITHALKIDPACAPAFTMRTLFRLAEKDQAGAVEDAKTAILLDPHAAESFVALATAYNSLKQFDKAQEAASHALGLHPDSFQGRLELAKSFYGEGHLILALRELELVGVDFPDVHLVRGNVLMGLDRSAEAVDEFEIFLKEAPSDSRTEKIRAVIGAARKSAPVVAGQE